MKVLIRCAGAVGLSVAARLSRVSRAHAIFRKITVGYPACLRNIPFPSTAFHHSPLLQDLSPGRETGIGFLNGAVVRNGREHGVPTPVDTCNASLICFCESPTSPGEQ